MKKQQNEVRKIFIKIRMNEGELKQVKKNHTRYVGTKKELNAVGNNFNQAVKKLHILDKIPELHSWILTNQTMQQSLIK